MTSGHLEIESKFDVDEAFQLPSLEDLDGVATVDAPVEHGLEAHELVPSSRLELFEQAGHFPHLDEPQRFLDVLLDFIESTDPADVDPGEWRQMLKTGRRA